MTKPFANRVFKLARDKSNVTCPPDQVFLNPNFEFLLTIGGDLIDNENEFEKLKSLLKDIGETEFNILENIGATGTERDNPFQTIVSLDSNYDDFQKAVSSFDPPFGWISNHFFFFWTLGKLGHLHL